jgi:hypothetical protein
VAQEVGRLADFRDRVGVGLAGLAYDKADERIVSLFEEVGGAAGARRGAKGNRGECEAARSPTASTATISLARA